MSLPNPKSGQAWIPPSPPAAGLVHFLLGFPSSPSFPLKAPAWKTLALIQELEEGMLPPVLGLLPWSMAIAAASHLPPPPDLHHGRTAGLVHSKVTGQSANCRSPISCLLSHFLETAPPARHASQPQMSQVALSLAAPSSLSALRHSALTSPPALTASQRKQHTQVLSLELTT